MDHLRQLFRDTQCLSHSKNCRSLSLMCHGESRSIWSSAETETEWNGPAKCTLAPSAAALLHEQICLKAATTGRCTPAKEQRRHRMEGKNSFSRADIILPKCQVVIVDCFYLCLNKQLPSENDVSLSTSVGVALTWASLARACQLWLPSTVMRGVFLEKAAATPAFKMHSQRGACRENPLALTADATAAVSPAPLCLATAAIDCLK